jgi:hypothetical protein
MEEVGAHSQLLVAGQHTLGWLMSDSEQPPSVHTIQHRRARPSLRSVTHSCVAHPTYAQAEPAAAAAAAVLSGRAQEGCEGCTMYMSCVCSAAVSYEGASSGLLAGEHGPGSGPQELSIPDLELYETYAGTGRPEHAAGCGLWLLEGLLRAGAHDHDPQQPCMQCRVQLTRKPLEVGSVNTLAAAPARRRGSPPRRECQSWTRGCWKAPAAEAGARSYQS